MFKRIGLLAMFFIGLMVVSTAARLARAEDTGKEENEKKIPFSEAPAAVRKTLKREANGAAIKSVDIEKRNGKTIYEADAVIDGTNYEILVAKNGMLISKAIDNEAEEGSKQAKSQKKEKDKEEAEDDEKSSKKAKSHQASREDDEDDDKPASAKAKAKKSDKVQKDDDDEDDDKASAKSGKTKTEQSKARKEDDSDEGK